MRNASLSGRVAGRVGPLAGARVSAVQLIGGVRLPALGAETDGDGAFLLQHLPPGAYELTVTRARFGQHQRTLWVLPGENRVEVRLSDAVMIEGQVVDDRNRPVPGALIEAIPRKSRQVVGTGRSDSEGRFVVDGLLPGIYRVRARRAGHLDAHRSAQAPMRGLRLHAARLYRVWGCVLGLPSGTPARVRIAGSGIWPGRTTTSSGCLFAFDRVPSGVYELVATSGEGKQALASQVLIGLPVGPSPPPPVLLGLMPGQRIEGRVASADGQPVFGATVSLGVAAGSVLRYQAETDGEGRFTLEPVVNGTYRIGAWARGFLPLLAWEIEAPVQLPLRLTLSRGGRLHGTVVDTAGVPVHEAVVGVEYAVGVGAHRTIGELGVIPGPVPPIPPPGLSFASGALVAPVSSVTAVTDRAGRYRLSGLLPGKLRLVARHPSYAEARGEWIELSEERALGVDPLVLEEAAWLSVRVLDERGRPLPGARLALAGSGWSRIGFTDASGSHNFGGLLGRIQVTAELQGCLPSTRRVRLASGQQLELDLALEPARGTLSGTILDANRMPVEGASVVATRGRHRLRATSDRSGYFQLTGVGKKPLELEVARADYVPLRRRVSPRERAGREVEIQLEFAAAVAGRVEDRRTGSPVTVFQLAFSAAGKQRRLSRRDPGGAFEIRGLSAGPAKIVASAPGYASAVHVAKVRRASRPHEVTVSDLVIALDRAGRIEGSVTSAATRQPLAGAEVKVGRLTTRTGADGRFRLDGVPEGSHRVEVRLGGHTARSDPVVVRADQTSGPLRVELP
jgi:protocatechuate 3,4-dioxygenase beta subunit